MKEFIPSQNENKIHYYTDSEIEKIKNGEMRNDYAPDGYINTGSGYIDEDEFIALSYAELEKGIVKSYREATEKVLRRINQQKLNSDQAIKRHKREETNIKIYQSLTTAGNKSGERQVYIESAFYNALPEIPGADKVNAKTQYLIYSKLCEQDKSRDAEKVIQDMKSGTVKIAEYLEALND